MRKYGPRVGDDQVMRYIVESGAFRLKERTHVERMPGQVKNARLATLIKAGDAQTARIKQRRIARIKAKTTVVFFGNLAFAIYGGNARVRLQDDGVGGLNQRTTKRSYQWQR